MEFIKKFGLNHHDFPTLIGNVAFLLKGLTINIVKKDNRHPPIIFYILTIFAVMCYFYVYVISMFWMVFVRFPKTKDITVTAVAISLSTCSFTCVTKFGFMKMYASNIRDTVHKFIHCNGQVKPGTRFASNLRKYLRIIKKRAMVIWICPIIDGLIYIIIPFILPGRHFTEDLYIIYGLEPMFESPNYEIATFLYATSICFGIFTMVNVAVYVIIIVGYTEAQMLALSEELNHVWDDSQNYYKATKYKIRNKIHAVYIKGIVANEFIRIRLRDIIKFHIININLLHELDHQFRNILAIEYGLMAIALIAELLGGLENTYLQLPYTLVQIFMDCLAGQRLIDACNTFENALYSCSKWEKFNVANRKTVFMMLLNSQKTLMLSAGGVTKLNFACLMAILRSTYSAYTTLKSAVNK